jgi:hypothetical protein
MVDRRKRLQEELDGIQKGWFIKAPKALADEASLCVFQKPDEGKEARAHIPRTWFEDEGKEDLIKQTVRAALANAKVKP